MEIDTKHFRTAAAARFLTQLGVSASVSLLTKLRTRGVDDPRGCGPPFTRDRQTGFCYYHRADLVRWASEQLARREPQSRAELPANFRRRARSVA